MFIPEVTQIQPLNVIVQQAPGMPEWVKILISAGVGAVFGPTRVSESNSVSGP
jgi:hypothetical protein